MDTERAAIGIDIGGTQLRAAMVAPNGTVLTRRRIPTPARDAELLIDTIQTVVSDLGAQVPVGVGVAALVTPDGFVHYGPNIAVRDLPLAATLQSGLGVPVTVINDASAAAVGEQRAGAGKGRDDVVLLTLGTGVGGGIIHRGQLMSGRHGLAGELGHVIVDDGGRGCPCGNRGCIEAYASGTAIATIAADRLASTTLSTALREVGELTGEQVTNAAVAGDELAQDVLREVGTWLGVACASIVNALDPEVILIGGGAGHGVAPWALPAAADAMHERLIGHDWREPPPLRLAALGDDAGMIGAALHALEVNA